MLYKLAAGSFYIMKLCSRLFVLHCRSRPKYDTSMHFDPHFEEVEGACNARIARAVKMEFSGKTVYGPVLKTTQLSAHAQNHASPERCRKPFTLIWVHLIYLDHYSGRQNSCQTVDS